MTYQWSGRPRYFNSPPTLTSVVRSVTDPLARESMSLTMIITLALIGGLVIAAVLIAVVAFIIAVTIYALVLIVREVRSHIGARRAMMVTTEPDTKE